MSLIEQIAIARQEDAAKDALLAKYRESHEKMVHERKLGVDRCTKDQFGDTRCALCRAYDRMVNEKK